MTDGRINKNINQLILLQLKLKTHLNPPIYYPRLQSHKNQLYRKTVLYE